LCLAPVGADNESTKNVLTYDEKYDKALNDKDTFVETVYTSKLGANIARGSGSISILSSIILMLIIHRSRIGLSTIYHRIMYCMSLADIMTSVAIALASAPMPKDMIYTQFKSGVYGNEATCTAQGIAFFLGSNIMFTYNSNLCVYYVCSIRYKMTEARIRKRVEPFLHVFAVLCALPNTIIAYFFKFFNPSPWDAWCTVTGIPWHCPHRQENAFDECYFHSAKTNSIPFYFVMVGFFIGFTCLFGSMILIILSVYKQEKMIKSYIEKAYDRKRANNSGISDESSREKRLESSRSRHHFTKVVSYQALAYIVVFVLCQTNVFISLFSRTSKELRSGELAQIYHLVTRPLQGFFNLLVFMGHKIYNLKQADRELTVQQAFFRVLTVREEPNFIFSQISMVAGGIEGEEEFNFEGDDEVEENGQLYPYPRKEGADEGEDTSSGISYYNPENANNTDMKDIDLSLSDAFEDNSIGRIAKYDTASSASMLSAQSSKRSNLSLDTKSWRTNKSCKD